ncbi:MAG TPA: cysteine--tRNA ligase [Caldisericia bacterium]|nr:cysteine--tRNA ligase [Caldisericia bacterium]
MNSIYFHDTMQGKKVEFEPRIPGEMSMYVCGLTTSNDSHIGHARTAIVFDVIRRIFRKNGYKVKYISNFTDIDDKIIQKAQEENTTAQEIAERYMHRYIDVIQKMHISEPDMYPKVTDHIPQIIEAVEKLIENGFAYESSGDVYFRVRKSEEYGKLSKKKLDELISGARILPGEKKEDPLDFALWKEAKPGEPFWESPWGNGRPGWHIECSVMALKYLGNHFDIHGGGQDLIFPHHENEIAQAEGITCAKPFCHYWIHTGWVTLDKVKMSKSVGNVFRIKDALKHYHPNVLRYFFLATLYSSPLEFNVEAIERAGKNVEKIATSIRRFQDVKLQDSSVIPPYELQLLEFFSRAQDEYHSHLRDNFNTPAAFGTIHVALRELNRVLDEIESLTSTTMKQIESYLQDFFETLGFVDIQNTTFVLDTSDITNAIRAVVISFDIDLPDENISLDDLVNLLIQKRTEARKNKDFSLSDEIRDQLQKHQIVLEDSQGKTTYRLEKQ